LLISLVEAAERQAGLDALADEHPIERSWHSADGFC
jgi:hypothetical protein